MLKEKNYGNFKETGYRYNIIRVCSDIGANKKLLYLTTNANMNAFEPMAIDELFIAKIDFLLKWPLKMKYLARLMISLVLFR